MATNETSGQSHVSETVWPPRLTVTAEGAIRIILGNFAHEQDQAKTELALLRLVNEAYEQGKRAALRERASHE